MKKKAEKPEAVSEVDALFQLPLADFTAARNALATRLKKGGHAAEAEEVKGLQKPSISAWVVNQLYWHQRAAFERLIDAGTTFRTAQAAQLSGKSTDIRGPLEARREALAQLSKLAADVLRSGGSPPNPDMMRRVTTTLEALSTYGGLDGTPRAGRLADDVDPPGFETLAALVPRIGKDGAPSGPSKVIPFQHQRAAKKHAAKNLDPQEEQRARLTTARQALQASERALRDARKAAEQAEMQLKKAAARAKETEKVAREVEKEKAAIDRRYEKTSADADAARAEARKIAEQAEAAAEAVEDTEREFEQARKALDSVTGGP